jgi:acyl-CoA thioesterase FadM
MTQTLQTLDGALLRIGRKKSMKSGSACIGHVDHFLETHRSEAPCGAHNSANHKKVYFRKQLSIQIRTVTQSMTNRSVHIGLEVVRAPERVCQCHTSARCAHGAVRRSGHVARTIQESATLL